MRRFRRWPALALAALLVCGPDAAAEERYFTLATTAATDNAGLFGHLLPRFTGRTGVDVRLLAVGSGQALRLARNGDADLLLLNDGDAERRLVADGHGLERVDVMYNDFVIVGPEADPAAIRQAETARDAFARIAAVQARFAAAGDGGGAHARELAIWTAAEVDTQAASGGWYRDSGLASGTALHAANDQGAYSLTDRASWIAFANRSALRLLFDRDPALFNQYGLVMVSPQRHPHVRSLEAQTFLVWLTSEEGQATIAEFRLEGQQVFVPHARPPAE